MDLGVRLRHPYKRLYMSHRNRDTANEIGLSSDVGVELRDLVLVDLCQLGSVVSLGINQVFF